MLAPLLWLALAGPSQEDPAAIEVEEPDVLWQVLQRAGTEQGKLEEMDGVVAHLRAMLGQQEPRGRCRRIAGMLSSPWIVPRSAAELRDLLEAPATRREQRFDGLVEGVLDWLDQEPPELPGLADLEEIWQEIADPEVKGIELLERLSEYLAAAHDLLAEPWSGAAEESLLFTGHAAAAEAWYRLHFPDVAEEAAAEASEVLTAFKEAVVAVDPSRPLPVAAALLRLADPPVLQGLAQRLARVDAGGAVPGVTGDVLAVVGASPESRVILGGRGRNTYDVAAALVLDLGGDDRYARAAVAASPELLASIVLDLAGDDVYEGPGPGPAYSVAGVALLVDRKGKDAYRGGRHAQAVTVAGFSLLLDEDGDDVYEAEDFSQAYAFTGTALLYDLEGRDRYHAFAYAQGAGNAYGFSALVDAEGDDEYLADLHWPDVYGDSGPDVFHGAAQGFNLGFRDAPLLAGGVAALVDLGGADRYQAGNFSQGGGYYFGFGLMYDGGGDDENHGTRYSQGFGVHQAVGMRWDEAGDDRYHTRTVANCGSAWDEGVGWLLDAAGDDVYEAGGLALGGAAQTAVAVFLDAQGDDRYTASPSQTLGDTGGSEYHEKSSVALFLDLGGGRDEYSVPGRGDGTAWAGGWNGVFVDTAEKTLERLLASRRPLTLPGK